MSKTALNDVVYNFEPLELCVSDPNYSVDDTELQKSIQKSQELISFIQDYKKRDERLGKSMSVGWKTNHPADFCS